MREEGPNGGIECERCGGIPVVLTVSDVMKVMGISRPKAYELSHQRGVPVVHVGRAIRVPRDAFVAWLSTQAGQTANGGV